MYKVELIEKEIREIGANRHAKTAWKRVMITFVVGLIAVFVGAYYWDYTLGKIWMIFAGIVWVMFAFHNSRQSGRAGRKFLEDIKNGKDEHSNI